MTARTGDVIHTVEQLEALPVGSVVLASTGKAYQRARDGGERGYGVVWAEAGGAYLTQPLVMVRWAPLTVLHVPGEQAGRRDLPTRDEIARALSEQTTCDGRPHPSELHYRQADAVLALLEGGKR